MCNVNAYVEKNSGKKRETLCYDRRVFNLTRMFSILELLWNTRGEILVYKVVRSALSNSQAGHIYVHVFHVTDRGFNELQ